MTADGSLAVEQRLRWLSEQLADRGAVSVSDAAAQLSVSEMTIRRDLAALEEQGAARRVRGGATAVGPQPFARRRHTAGRAKARIAAKLVGLVPQGGAVAFDASSTIMRLAGLLQGANDLTVLTNGPDTFHALRGRLGVTPVLTGGRLEERTGSLVGPLACGSADRFQAETFFASAAAISAGTGSLEATLEEAEVKRTIAGRAGRVVLAVDSTKLESTAMAMALDWARIDVLVSELDPGHEALDPYRELACLV